MGHTTFVRAIFDTGAEINVITSQLVKSLNLTVQRTSLQVYGITGDEQTSTGSVNIQVSPWFDQTNTIKLFKTFFIMKSIPIEQKIQFPDLTSRFSTLQKADPKYNQPGRVEMLLGIDTWAEIVQNQVIRNKSGLCAQKTQFGYVIFGSIPREQPGRQHYRAVNTVGQSERAEASERLDQLIEKFWLVEEISNEQVKIEDARAEEIFVQTVKRSTTGRYIVSLPLVEPQKSLGDSRTIAYQRFTQLERRLEREPQLRAEYNTFMQEYIQLGHMRIAKKSEKMAENGYYIPHHAVTKRFRVVFDASCATTNGNSVNDIQLTGPNLQEELDIIVMRFRSHRLVLIADIKKMYRQIEMTAEDLKYQKIFWRFKPDEPIKEYVLLTVTYGMKSSPFLAVRTMLQIAEDYEHKYPRAAQATKWERYMDDYMTGTDDEEQLIELYTQLNTMLMEGQFELSKWKTNCHKLAEQIRADTAEHTIELNDTATSVLGLKWLPGSDCFTFEVRNIWAENTKPTKRNILAAIARIYDPCGFLAPVIIVAKTFMQELWKRKLDWDQDLSTDHQELVTRWNKYFKGLQALNEVKIPRWCGSTISSTISLYGFADASELGYGAVLYVHCSIGNEQQMTLLTSKTRVAPLKPLTIPRMELCAAVLLAKLKEKVQQQCSFLNVPCFLHSDSMITLAWIKTNPSALKQYVASRVVAINELTSHAEWSYVRSKSNPADICSRGMPASDLIKCELWWRGSLNSQEQTPESLSKQDSELISAEHRKVFCCTLTHTIVSWLSKDETPLIELYSDHGKLVRITALTFKAMQKFKSRNKDTKTKETDTITTIGHLTPRSLREADLYWVKYTQLKHYPKELRAVEAGENVTKTSPLAQLTLMLDAEKILRVFGRISQSELTYDEKHPIILPADSIYGALILRAAHAKTFHGGIQQMLHTIRTKYWLTGGRRAARTVTRSCNICRRFRGHPVQQLMGSLPKERITAVRPFAYCGVDYFGPIKVRRNQTRSSPTDTGYVAVFICLVTRMIHLECVSDLTTARFLWALQRLAAIYQMPLRMCSDNAKTFKGAANELRNIHATWKAVGVASYLTERGTTWQFITPRAPFQGGIWEAAVKSVKHHSNRILRSQRMTFEQYQTLLAKIGAVLNSHT